MLAWIPPAVFERGGWLAVALLVGLAFFALRFLLQLCVCVFLYRAGSDVPAEHRELEPALAFLLLVPCLDLCASFLVQPCLARSYRRWLAARGAAGEGDCGENLAWWHALLGVCGIVPCVNLLALPAAIVLHVLFLVRLARVRRSALGLARA